MNRLTIAATTAGATLALTGGGIALAATSGGAPKRQAPAAVFQQQLAKQLGISTDRLSTEAKQAETATVDALQADGRIDADHAAKLRQRIAKRGAAPFARLGTPRRGNPTRAAALKALLAASKLEPNDLRAARKSADSPAALIQQHGADAGDVSTAVHQAVRDQLQHAVDAGRITAAQADTRATKIADRLTGDQPIGGRAAAGTKGAG
jgi:hypothetical protein